MIFVIDSDSSHAFYTHITHRLATSLSPARTLLGILTAVALCAPSAQAGGFGGPAPFQNGSPLMTGTDGVYQAVASAKNVVGIISFAIRGGVQTSSANDNNWIFFVDGQILSGQTSANISQEKVAGVLDTTVSGGFPTNEDGTVDLPIAFVVPGNAGAGSFTGKINLNDPVAAFSGEGILSGTPERTDQIVLVSEPTILPSVPPVAVGGVQIVPLTIPGSDLGDIKFKLRGTRLSTTTTVNFNSNQ